jgi:hypothetical protein
MTFSERFGAAEPRCACEFNFVGRVTARRMDCTGPEDSLRGPGIVKANCGKLFDDREVVSRRPDHREDMVEREALRAEDRGLFPPMFVARLCDPGDM